MEFNTTDVLIVLTILASTAIGIYRGFLREIISIFTWLLAAIFAYIYGKACGDYLVFLENPAIKEVVGMLLVFITVLLIGGVVKAIVTKAGKIPGVTIIDRLLGALFGILRGGAIIIIVLLVSSNNIHAQDWYKNSAFIDSFAKVAFAAKKAIPETWKDEVVESLQAIVTPVKNGLQSPAPVEKAVPTTTTKTRNE